MNGTLSTYYVDGIEVNYVYKSNPSPSVFTMDVNFIWINNLPEHYELLNEGDKMKGAAGYLSRNNDHLIELNPFPTFEYWSIDYFPVVKEKTELEFID